MNKVGKQLRELGQGAMTLGRYLHGDSRGEQQARRYDTVASRGEGGRTASRRGAGEFGTEPRDPLEIMLLAGDRDEFVDKSFWHDAETGGVTFTESRVDGKWEDEGGEMWK